MKILILSLLTCINFYFINLAKYFEYSTKSITLYFRSFTYGKPVFKVKRRQNLNSNEYESESIKQVTIKLDDPSSIFNDKTNSFKKTHLSSPGINHVLIN